MEWLEYVLQQRLKFGNDSVWNPNNDYFKVKFLVGTKKELLAEASSEWRTDVQIFTFYCFERKRPSFGVYSDGKFGA